MTFCILCRNSLYTKNNKDNKVLVYIICAWKKHISMYTNIAMQRSARESKLASTLSQAWCRLTPEHLTTLNARLGRRPLSTH